MKLPRANKGIIPVLILLLQFLLTGVVFAGVPTEVVLNKSVLLNLNKPAERVSVTNPAIADLLLISPRQLQINGIAIGSTTLIVWEKGEKKPSFFDVNVIGDVSQLETQIKEVAPNDSITLGFARDTMILSGKAANEQTVAKALQIAQAYAPKVLNHIRIDEPHQVLLQVKVAQVDKTALKRLGISGLMKGKTAEGFYNTIAAPSSGGGGTTGGTGAAGGGIGGGAGGIVPSLGSYSPLSAFQAGVAYFPAGIASVIQALVTKNLAKILAEPNLLVKSGQKGNFLAGSKIPYPIVTSTGGTATTSVYFVDVGIKLNFAPQVMENGMIALKIDPAEVSNLQGTNTVGGFPVIDTREVRTDVELKEGESLVLAGLLQEEEIAAMSKIPLLGDIPILGALFRSSQKDIREKELVFFITPKVVKPTAPGTKTELPTDKLQLPDTEKLKPEQEKELKWMPLGN